MISLNPSHWTFECSIFCLHWNVVLISHLLRGSCKSWWFPREVIKRLSLRCQIAVINMHHCQSFETVITAFLLLDIRQVQSLILSQAYLNTIWMFWQHPDPFCQVWTSSSSLLSHVVLRPAKLTLDQQNTKEQTIQELIDTKQRTASFLPDM